MAAFLAAASGSRRRIAHPHLAEDRSTMTSVELLETQVGRMTVPVGRIDFYMLPVQTTDDFEAVPPGILSFADVQAISIELFRTGVQGRIGRYKWRKIT
jgi:hypothetical protein